MQKLRRGGGFFFFFFFFFFFGVIEGVKFVVYKSRSKFRARDVKDPTIFTTIFSVESYITGNAVRCFLSLSFFFNFLIPLCCVECILPPINATCTIKNNTSPHQKKNNTSQSSIHLYLSFVSKALLF